MTKIGSLFTGYGGLDMAVRMALDPDARVAWTSDVEPGPCRLAEVRWPGIPNIGDITQVDWSDVEPVDIICGGSPCQDLSLAGRRAGMASGTRSGLWESMFEAIKTLRPRLVVWENVRGSLTSGAFSLVESEKGLLGDGADGSLLRAAGRVVGDLAGLGYDSQWRVVRASDVGAPHQRERLFVTSHPAGEPWQLRGIAGAGEAAGRGALGEPGRPDRASCALIPTPTASDHKAGRHQEGTGKSLSQAVQMLPTPQATNATASSTGYGANLHEVARELLPTPKAGDAVMGLPRTSGRPPEKSTHLATRLEYTDYGMYAPAIARWEQVLGREAPAPTVPPTREGGRARLSTRFVEWLMGLPEGHVTGEDLGLTREQQLRLLGNGVVPQQGAAAIYQLTKIAIEEAA
nr:MAG TPA: Cytosine specific methyltransferase [Caudoviricetes sp.]